MVGDNYNTIKTTFDLNFILYQAVNPIPVGWGWGVPGNPPPPTFVFEDNSKRIGVRLYTFFYFSNYLAPHFRLKARLLYLLPESSGILPECLILPLLD